MSTAAWPRPQESRLRADLLQPQGGWAHLEIRDEVDSTNSVLAAQVRAATGSLPTPAVLIAHQQTAGHGRLGRRWLTPAGSALTMSVRLTVSAPPAAPESRQLTWLPLIAGLAAVRGIRAQTGLAAVLKWPNDVLVPIPGAPPLAGVGSRRKVAGILSEVVASQAASDAADRSVIIGIGVNVGQRADELPVPTATSLVIALAAIRSQQDAAAAEPAPGSSRGLGVGHAFRDDLAVAILTELSELLAVWQNGALNQVWIAAISEHLATLGSRVRVELSTGDVLTGTAVTLAHDGALVLHTDDGASREIRSGDVFHLREVDEARHQARSACADASGT